MHVNKTLFTRTILMLFINVLHNADSYTQNCRNGEEGGGEEGGDFTSDDHRHRHNDDQSGIFSRGTPT